MSETFERCAGIVYIALRERMSHMRIVSSPAPVAIWYLKKTRKESSEYVAGCGIREETSEPIG
jgi:hypothetical protein